MLANHSHAIQPQSWYPPIVMLHNPSCYATIFMLLRHVMLSNQSCYSMTIMLPKQVMLSKHHHDIQMCHVIHRSCCLTTVSHVTQLPSCYPTTVMLCKPIMPSNHDHGHSMQTSHVSQPPSCYSNMSCFPTTVMLCNQSCYLTTIMLLKQVMLFHHLHATQPCVTCEWLIAGVWKACCQWSDGQWCLQVGVWTGGWDWACHEESEGTSGICV